MNERFRHKKSLGQHFLNNPHVPRAMCDAAEIVSGDTVLEIGPGTGALTKELLDRGARVIALEADERAIAALKGTFSVAITDGTLIIHLADVRTLDVAAYGLTDGGYKVVSNIPYYLTGSLFRSVLEQAAKPSRLVFLVQKEVAKRATAHERGEKESLLSLSIQAYGNAMYVKTVSRGNFTPPPNVDSAIVLVRDIAHDRLTGVNPAHFFTLLHLGFGQKRKQLRGNLSSIYSRETITDAFDALDLPHDIRAEDMSFAIWRSLATALPPLDTTGL